MKKELFNFARNAHWYNSMVDKVVICDFDCIALQLMVEAFLEDV